MGSHLQGSIGACCPASYYCNHHVPAQSEPGLVNSIHLWIMVYISVSRCFLGRDMYIASLDKSTQSGSS